MQLIIPAAYNHQALLNKVVLNFRSEKKCQSADLCWYLYLRSVADWFRYDLYHVVGGRVIALTFLPIIA